MSAIFGIYYLDGRKVETENLKRMADSLPHRGSDAIGFWSEHSVGFGHRMLWITPESLHEKLPFCYTSNGTQITITADARLDNREELIQILGRSGRPHEQISDSELILHAYQKWGDKCPEKLLGDFAFAIWDHKKQRLFCARDHFGIKPFFYHYLPNRIFVFASEIKALLCLPEVPVRLNETMVGDFLGEIYEDKWITFYRDVIRLPPAYRIKIDCNKMTVESYWALDPSREIRFQSQKEYEERFRDLFRESVRTRLRGRSRAGFMLSGGLDSSSVACMAKKLYSEEGWKQLPTFSYVFDEISECDERSYIQAVLDQKGFEPHYIHGDRVAPLGNLDRLLDLGDEPHADPTLCLAWSAYQIAEEQNVRIILDGLGGDEAVWYNLTFLTEFARAGRWKEIAVELQAYSARKGIGWGKKAQIFWLRCVKPFIPEKPRQLWRKLRGRKELLLFNDTLVKPEFARRMHLAERSQTFNHYKSRTPESLREEQFFYLTSHLRTQSLESYERVTALLGCENRYPFFDKRLVEFCLAMPVEQKFHQGWPRSIVRRALSGILPEKIRRRMTKIDIYPYIVRSFLMFERERIKDVVINNPGFLESYVDLKALKRSYDRLVKHPRVEEVPAQDLYNVWNAVTLGLWLRHTKLRS